MYGSRKKTKAIIVAILSLVLLLNAFLPMTVMGKNDTKAEDYEYYVIKRGDTLTKIAKNYGVGISDIMTLNGLKDANRIIAGNVIKIPTVSGAAESGWVNTRITLKVKDANIVDVLSLIAYNAGYTVIYEADVDQKITVDLEEMSTLKAIDYVTRLAGLSYLKDGNTVMVGSASSLNSTFIDKVVMTKFTLQYTTADVIQAQAAALGLENVQYVVTEQDANTVYVSAYPKELAKIKELISLLDVPANIKAGGELIPEHFTYIELTYISATEFSGLLANLGLDAGITLVSRPYTLYTFATGAAFTDIMQIKAIVDRPLSGADAAAAKTGVSDQTVNNNTTNNNTTNNNTTNNNTTTTTDSTSGSTSSSNKQILRELPLTYIDRAEAVKILESFDGAFDVKILGPSNMTKKLWLLGNEEDVNNATSKLQSFDTETYANSTKLENTFFIYDLQNITANELKNRIEHIELDGVTIVSNSYSTVSKTVTVYCAYEKQDQVKALLAALDTAESESIEYRAIENTPSVGVASDRIAALRQVHPEIPADTDFQYVTSPNKTGEGAKCTTYVNTTATMAEYVKALLAELDSAG